ncbi:MAG: ABC transporter ATP-binding protein/permease [Ignavibacteria bacterium]|nr:ABC transporter ATP-binding protein/permease [Ignavibacteria bacterium]
MKALLSLVPYLKRYKRTLIFGFVTVLMSNIFTVVQPFVIGRAIDSLEQGLAAGEMDESALLGFAGMIIGFSLIAGIFTYLTRQTIIVVSRHVEYDLRNDYLSHLQKLPLQFFQVTPTGDLMAHATNDISAVRSTLGPGIMYPADTFITFTMVLAIMLSTDWQLTLLALVPLPFVSYAVYRLGKIVHKKFRERQEQYSLLTTKAQENLSGIRVVRAYVREKFETVAFRAMSHDYLLKNLYLARVQSIMWPAMYLLVGFSMIITLYVGGLRVIDGALTVGTLTAFFGYLLMLIWPMVAFGWVINILQQGSASMERLLRIIETAPSIQDSGRTDSGLAEIRGSIEFRDVHFRHEGADADTLAGINLTVPRGSTLAIVGYTGAGKTTLVNLIPRLYEATGGEVLIDGRDIRTVPIDLLRSRVGYVPQETFLFSDTIAANIGYGVDEPGEQGIREAAEISQILNDVTEFPKEFETMVGERGITLSGGQKQRTSIARAVMRKPAILILDDALSAVDTYTEEEILKRLRTVMKERTSIIISHRISTVKDADQIIVLNDGRIVEQGTHQQLLETDGIYAELNRKQLLEKELEQL